MCIKLVNYWDKYVHLLVCYWNKITVRSLIITYAQVKAVVWMFTGQTASLPWFNYFNMAQGFFAELGWSEKRSQSKGYWSLLRQINVDGDKMRPRSTVRPPLVYTARIICKPCTHLGTHCSFCCSSIWGTLTDDQLKPRLSLHQLCVLKSLITHLGTHCSFCCSSI